MAERGLDVSAHEFPDVVIERQLPVRENSTEESMGGLTKQPHQQTLRLYRLTGDAAGAVPREEEGPSCAFRVALEHQLNSERTAARTRGRGAVPRSSADHRPCADR